MTNDNSYALYDQGFHSFTRSCYRIKRVQFLLVAEVYACFTIIDKRYVLNVFTLGSLSVIEPCLLSGRTS